MLAPPALYIPRHCRGTPFERGRCRRDACTVICILNPATSTLIILRHRQTDCHRESPLERGTAEPGGMYRKQIQKVHIVFSSIDKRTATASPLLRGVRRSRGVCIGNPIQKVHIKKGLLQYMLAPPALYIPRHCRGTPFERGRCRRDACTVMYSPNAVAPQNIRLRFLLSSFPLCYPFTIL